MRIDSSVEKKAFSLGIDKVLDCYIAANFTEITGKKGNDVVTLRIYHDGRVVER